MELLQHLEEYRAKKPLVLTIGNFDGVHRGHQAVLKHVREDAQRHHSHSVVMTFKNHPSTILRPEQTIPLLCTLQHRVQLLEKEQIDFLLMLAFTPEFAKQTAEIFLKNILLYLPVSKLILGHDAVLGKDRQGNPVKIKELSKALNFKVEYTPPYMLEGISISSSKIRDLIQKGDLQTAEKFLGRKYSILSTVISGMGKGKTMGFPTANIHVQGLCLPPLGVYAIKAVIDGKLFDGIANLGIAPTLKTNQIPILEAHFFDNENNLYGKSIEILFYNYIRPEKRFADIHQLKDQISKDVQTAKKLLAKQQPQQN